MHMTTIDPQVAFENAIDAGILSNDPEAPNYAGRYMFMGERENGDCGFKHRDTRQYIWVEIA